MPYEPIMIRARRLARLFPIASITKSRITFLFRVPKRCCPPTTMRWKYDYSAVFRRRESDREAGCLMVVPRETEHEIMRRATGSRDVTQTAKAKKKPVA